MKSNDSATTTRYLKGRISYLRTVGRMKDPDLMQMAVDTIDNLTAKADALLRDLGAPEDGSQANLMLELRKAISDAVGD